MSMEGDHLKPDLGFIGMGHMGSHMAQRLLDASYQVTVYDRIREKAKAPGHRGAQAYGFCLAERMLSEALQPELRSQRDKIVLATRGG